MSSGPRAAAPRSRDRSTLVTGGLAAAVPLAGLALLLRRPALDLRWEHHPSHFWLVLGAAALSAVVAYGTGVASIRRADARVFLVSLTFLSAAGFLGLHALATPGVLLGHPNAGFVLATPVGVALGAVFAAWSAIPLEGERGVRLIAVAGWVRTALVALMVLWAVASLAELPPLHGDQAPEKASGPLVAMALVAIALYGWAAYRYLALWRTRRGTMPLAVAAAVVLLAEAMVALLFAPNWHLSWWEWHVLMLAAFTLVAWGAQRQWHEERFVGLYLEQTVSGRREMSILFADLQGFTTFSEAHEPQEVTAMLNAYFRVAIPPVVSAHGGDIDRLIGDAIMATFNRRGDQPDHARRAAAAALAMQEATAVVAAQHPGWPRFRAAVNTGEVSVSVLGVGGGRTHTVIGDAVNVASRLEAKAPVGGVAVSAATARLLPNARTEPLGTFELKGKAEPVEAFVLTAL
ncbi:adenylate/guanylate cyclase domain-containing protein [Pedococcus sp. 5OH_020]|uniref:adenylate/guanylate cyclase domain-containing protein n=1 Tax=Pedococcus sp. 5OH_020 TaxID=2989814 RepID=UPI0022E9DFF9|nr:adenylate/guanylate cyclase domain-containing protein [Pedococcus sp. 5OH_020]